MRMYRNKIFIKKVPKKVVCNICGLNIQLNKDGYFNDYLHIEKQWGYFSKKDGVAHSIDICENCYDKVISQMKIPPNSSPTSIS